MHPHTPPTHAFILSILYPSSRPPTPSCIPQRKHSDHPTAFYAIFDMHNCTLSYPTPSIAYTLLPPFASPSTCTFDRLHPFWVTSTRIRVYGYTVTRLYDWLDIRTRSRSGTRHLHPVSSPVPPFPLRAFVFSCPCRVDCSARRRFLHVGLHTLRLLHVRARARPLPPLPIPHSPFTRTSLSLHWHPPTLRHRLPGLLSFIALLLLLPSTHTQ